LKKNKPAILDRLVFLYARSGHYYPEQTFYVLIIAFIFLNAKVIKRLPEEKKKK